MKTPWSTHPYIHTHSGFVYLTSIMDLYSRLIIDWQISDNLSTAAVLQAIKKAKAKRVVRATSNYTQRQGRPVRL